MTNKISSPYLHDLYKAILTYNSEGVVKILKQYYPQSKLLYDWKIVESRQEIILIPYYQKIKGEEYNHKIGDAIWIIQRLTIHNDKIYRPIVHEIKTGKADINEIYEDYSNVRYNRPDVNYRITGMGYLWIWAWQDIFDKSSLTEELNEKIQQTRVRLIPLEYLQPLLNEVIQDLNTILK